MNRRILIILSCALILSVCASYLVYRAIGVRAAPAKLPPTAHLVVAAHDLAAGTLIQDADLKVAAWLGPLPAGSNAKRDSFLNRGVISPIYADEPVTENRLSAKGSGGGLAAMIPPGMRACAVKVNEVVGVAGFVVPGMRVDVLVTGLPPGGNATDGPRVRTLLQDIQVLSAGTNFQKDQAGKPEQVQVVNLLVTPDEAEVLSLASNETHIQLVLRNPMDTQISQPPGAMVSSLFGGGHAPGPVSAERSASPRPRRSAAVPVMTPPAPPAAPEAYTVEVLNGGVHTQVKFVQPGAKQ